MNKVRNWDKFKLLLWKNWLLQWNNKWQLVVEILLPVVFAMLLVLVRRLVVPEPMPEVRYPPLSISDIKIFKHFLDLGKRGQTLLKIFLPKASKAVSLDRPVRFPELKLLFSPNTSTEFIEIIKSASNSLHLKEPEGFFNADELNYALTRGNYLAGVAIDENAEYPRKFSYALRFPSELRTSPMVVPLTWATAKLFMPFDISGPRNVNDTDGGVPVGYLREGFLPIQHAISTAYIKRAGGIETLPEVKLQRFPYPEYIFDPLLSGLAPMMSLIIMLSFTYPCTYITKYVTAEKEKQLKEIMKIMGLQNWLHWAAWFIKSFIMLGISSIFIVIFMKVNWAHDVSVLTHSNFAALVFFLLVYVTASICFCFMLATFFSRANTAAAVTGLLWFIAYLPFSFTMNSYDQMSLGEKLTLSLLSNTAMGFGFKVILGWEGKGEGLQWNNIFSSVSVDDSLSLGVIILMMLLSSIMYLLICLYVEQIFPGEYGVPRKWNFPFTLEFWRGNHADMMEPDNQVMDNKSSPNPDAFEPEPTGKRVGVHVKNLKKKFGGRYAVKNLSMRMYENDITVLLGHNGAGKTTTISMLTGIFPPTAGTAIINGSDIRSSMEGARLSMGICPQHNVLFDSLTVANHLEFYSRLKGLKGGAVQREVKKYLKIIQLEDKANVASSKLSGGMKRKLSICCALCGDTKVVLCDEPSSGMDPAARRQLWDLLQSEKVGRTVLLTTHFMDEADVLGDRIAIMCEGELKCMGTSFFLKKKYGSGYRLICVKLKDCRTEEVTALLNKFIPGIKPVSDVGAELSYALPHSYTPIFEKMFQALEDNSAQLRLNGYGVSITSLEEVFMKVGAENGNSSGGDSNSLAALNGDGGARRLDDDLESVQSDRPFSEKANLLQGSKLCFNQWHAMLLKKFLYTLRNKLLFFVQNCMPIFFVVVTILIARSRGTFQPLPRMTVSLTQYPKTVSVLERDMSLNDLNADAPEVRIADQYKALVRSYGPAHKFVSTGKKDFNEYILDLGKTMQVLINSRYVTSVTVAKGKITAWLNNQPLHTAPLTVNMVHNAMARALVRPDAEITVTNAPLPYTPETKIAQLNVGNSLGTQLALNLCFCMCFVSGFYILFLIRERESRAKLLQFVSGVNVWTFWLTQFIWDMITFGVTAVVVILAVACFREEGFSQISELMRYFIVFIIFGLSAIPLTYLLSFLFSEPATGFARVSTLYIFSGMALFMVIFVMSFEFFDTKETADQLQMFFRAFPHFSLANSMNKLHFNTAIRKACSNPIVEMLPDQLRCKMVPKCCKTIPFFDWVDPGILPEIVYLLGTAVVFFILLILNEYGVFTEIVYRINKLARKPLKPSASTDPENEDVTAEKECISSMSMDEIANQNLVLDRVSKRYKNFWAVNEISLCVKSNECFGLLGVNGAGKTSTFKMLTGDERISSGAAYVKGLSLKTDLIEINKEIGYCPQFDALFDDLTGRETLKIICLLRGLRRREILKVSEQLCHNFGFTKHMDKMIKAYSGGNKRKLSVALAVIGSPSIIYLDEPTTGMDPAARRRLWNMVCRIRDSGKSIVLTSHSMEECEALCTRLSIMVNGEFKCIGSTQHLKNKFSKGLILKIKLKRHDETRTSITAQSETNNVTPNDNDRAIIDQVSRKAEKDAQNIKRFIQEKFPDSVLKEEYICIFTFYIPLTTIRWSTIFGLMESNRARLNIEDYSISQTTLEEIFLEFAKFQKSTPQN